jgi:hypothetical protein
MSQKRPHRPIATGGGLGTRCHRAAGVLVAAAVLTSAGTAIAGPALGAAVQVSAPSQGFPIKPTEPTGSWKLKRAVTVTANCQPPGSATSCPAIFTLFAQQLGPTAGLPTIPNATQLSKITNVSVPAGQQQTVTLRFKLSHQILNLIYKYGDPRCYVQAQITTGPASNQAQPQVFSESVPVNIGPTAG